MPTVSETITLEVQTACDNPIQLRWKNRLGGWNYYVFDLKQVKGIDTDSTSLFREPTKYIEDVRKVLSFYKKEGREVWSLFAENIPSSHVELIQGIAQSPEVGLYIGEEGSPLAAIYNTVIVEGYETSLDTFLNRHNVSVNIRLLELEPLTNL